MEYQEENNYIDGCDVSKCKLWIDDYKIYKCSGMRKCEGTDCLFKSKELRKITSEQNKTILNTKETMMKFRDKNQNLTLDNYALKKTNERLEIELKDAIGAIDNVRKAKEDLQKENRLLNELKDENSLRISQLVTKLCEIDSRCVELQKKCERLIQEKYELHDEIQTQKGQIHSLKEDLEAESKEAHRWYAEETDSFFAFLSVCGLLDRYKECLEAVKEMSKNANLPNISLYIESFLDEMSQKSFSKKVKDVMFTPDKEITESGLRRKDE